MAEIIREITVDVAKANVFQSIVAKQFDSNSRFLKATITNDGEPLTIPSSASVTINALREDGNAEAFLGSVNDDGTITVPLSNWMLQHDGIVKCDISIVTADSKLTTTMFSLAVEEAAYGGSDISDDPNYDLLVQLLDECAVAKTGCVDAIEELTAAKENGDFNGSDGISVTHQWDGTVLTITSASGTSSSDLKGEKGDTGAAGQNGVSVTKTEINNKGELIITLSDNTVSNLGVVVGAKGDKGDTGATGATGATGEKGDKGDKGDDGKDGKDGADYILTDDDKSEIAAQVSGDCVSYSEAQALTDEQKQMARTNIDAVSQTELEDGLDKKVDASLVVSNIVSDTGWLLSDSIPNGDAVADFVLEHGVAAFQDQSLSEARKARARSNINAAEDTGKWELLYTIEGDGETNIWEFTKFADGSGLKLRAAAVKTINTVAASADTYGYMYACDSSSNVIGTAVITKFLSKTAGAVALGIIEQDKGYYRAYAVEGSYKNPGNVKYSGFQQYNEIGNIEITPYIPKIKVNNQTTAYLPVGSTIEVWGVKA